MDLDDLISALSQQMPSVLRWSGAIARQLRRFDVSLSGQKTSGSPNTDALTLADLTVQELLVAALRDGDSLFRQCKVEAEETTGDLKRFADEAVYTISLDPIDGTKQYRDKTGNGYGVLLHVRSAETVHYSLCYLPESGPHGTWVAANGEKIAFGPDDPNRPAADVLHALPAVDPAKRPKSKQIYLIGFQDQDPVKAQLVTDAGLEGRTAEQMQGSIFELQACGEYAGSLIHTPNVYDYPISLHLARILGGDSVWVHNGRPVHFRETWLDDRADMLRMPGIIATSDDREVLDTLCELARDWNQERYA